MTVYEVNQLIVKLSVVVVSDALLLDVAVQLRLDDLSRTVKIIVSYNLVDFVGGQDFVGDEASCVGNLSYLFDTQIAIPKTVYRKFIYTIYIDSICNSIIFFISKNANNCLSSIRYVVSISIYTCFICL